MGGGGGGRGCCFVADKYGIVIGHSVSLIRVTA